MTTIRIEYGIIVNGRGKDHGYLPYMRVNGRGCGNTWQGTGYSKDDAVAESLANAQYESRRYAGDWNIELVNVGEMTP